MIPPKTIKYNEHFYPVRDDVFQYNSEKEILFTQMGMIMPFGYLKGSLVCIWRKKYKADLT